MTGEGQGHQAGQLSVRLWGAGTEHGAKLAPQHAATAWAVLLSDYTEESGKRPGKPGSRKSNYTGTQDGRPPADRKLGPHGRKAERAGTAGRRTPSAVLALGADRTDLACA